MDGSFHIGEPVKQYCIYSMFTSIQTNASSKIWEWYINFHTEKNYQCSSSRKLETKINDVIWVMIQRKIQPFFNEFHIFITNSYKKIRHLLLHYIAFIESRFPSGLIWNLFCNFDNFFDIFVSNFSLSSIPILISARYLKINKSMWVIETWKLH